MPPENSAGELIRTMVVMMSATASFARKAMLIKAKLSGRSGDSRSKQFECGQRSCMLPASICGVCSHKASKASLQKRS